jgi:hypothetical protein
MMNVERVQLPGGSAPGARLWVAVSPDTDRGTVRLFGELDFTGTDRLHAVLDWLRHDGHRHIVVELTELGFLSAADYAECGGSLLLCPGPPALSHSCGAPLPRG